MTDLLTILLLASLLGLGAYQGNSASPSTTTATGLTINPDPGGGTVPPGK